MKKGSILFSFLLVLLLGFSQVYAQDIFILKPQNSAPPNAPYPICQCDTLGLPTSSLPDGIQYDFDATFPGNTQFFYEMTFNGDFSSPINLPLHSLEAVPSTPNPVDSFGVGIKKAYLIMPCIGPTLGSNAQFRIRASNGEISDTAYFNVTNMPVKPTIDSIYGGDTNRYTTVDDWGFCRGDSITLFCSDRSPANYEWFRDGAPVGDDINSLVVKESGTYWVEVSLGICSIRSKDTLINVMDPPELITLVNVSSAPRAFQIDKQGAIGERLDSVQFCEDSHAKFRANSPSPTAQSNGVLFTYEWLYGIVDQISGDTNYVPASGKNDSAYYFADTTGIFAVAIQDNFGCIPDTSAPYFAFMDTIPDTYLQSQQFDENGSIQNPVPGPTVCMTDSILLSTPLVVNDTLEFQWYIIDNAGNPDPIDMAGYGREGDQYTVQVDTSMFANTPPYLSKFFLEIWTLTPYTHQHVCSYTSDTMLVRWKPVDSLLHQMDPWVHTVGFEHINFCERDSATLIASSTPNSLITSGFTYSYQWMRDSLDTNSGQFVKAPIIGETARTLVVRESGTYYAYIDDGICGDTVRPYTVTVDSLPTTTVVNVPATADRNLCLTDSVEVSATDTVRGPNGHWKYQWLSDVGTGWVPLLNDTLPNLVIDTAYRPAGVDTIWFSLLTSYENQFGIEICPDTTAQFSVHFFDPPTINFTPGDSIGVCPGDSVLVIAMSDQNATFLWDDGKFGQDNWLSGAGRYSVTVTGTANGCTSTRDVVIYDLVTVADAGPDVTIFSGETAELTATGGIDYQWGASKPIAWGNILSANTSVSYTLPEGVKSDTIQVYVKVSSSNGCFAFDTLNLFVVIDESAGTALIDQAWNVFTPDGNGKSDVWDISSITDDYGGCRIDIMNRWGSVIFVDESFDGIWDGTNNGSSPMSDGTYYYILSCDGEIILKNSVTIIRNQ